MSRPSLCTLIARRVPLEVLAARLRNDRLQQARRS